MERNKPVKFSRAYTEKDWSQMRDKKREKILQAEKEFNDRLSKLNDLGFYFYKSLSAGTNSTYSWKHNGVKSPYGADSIEECMLHIEGKLMMANLMNL